WGRGQKQRHTPRLVGEVARYLNTVAGECQPLFRLIEARAHFLQRAIGQLRIAAPEGEEVAMPLQHAPTALAADLRPVELTAAEGRLVLRVGDVFRFPVEWGELLTPALADRVGEREILMVGEVLKSPTRPPLLTLEEHGDEGGEQNDCRGSHELRFVDKRRQ